MTVVLDRSLYSLPRRAYSEGELLLRIGLSAWMSRCWTMQEAVIAGGALMVRFADGWLPLLHLVASVRQKSSVIAVNVMADEQRTRVRRWRHCLAAVIMPLFIVCSLMNPGQLCAATCRRLICGGGKKEKKSKAVMDHQDGGKGPRLAASASARLATLCHGTSSTSIFANEAEEAQDSIRRIVLSWNGLRYRNTSRATDRFINFAFGCAKNDAEFAVLRDVLRLPVQDRLRAWYRGQRALPTGLLFLRGPRMDAAGFRWRAGGCLAFYHRGRQPGQLLGWCRPFCRGRVAVCGQVGVDARTAGEKTLPCRRILADGGPDHGAASCRGLGRD